MKRARAHRVPCREGDAVAISWKPSSTAGEVEYTVTTAAQAEAVMVRGWGGAAPGAWTRIQGTSTCTLRLAVSR